MAFSFLCAERYCLSMIMDGMSKSAVFVTFEIRHVNPIT